MQTSTRLFRLLPALLLAAVAAPAAPAEPAANLTQTADPTFQFRLGGFLLSDIETSMRLDTGTNNGTSIDFADVLGGESSANVFRADANWRFAARHQVDAAWFDIDLKATRTLTREIEFGDETYTINTTVNSGFRTSIYKLSYGYAFKRSARHEITGLIGAHIIRLDTSIAVPNVGRLQRFAATAPLPAFGLAWSARWSDRLTTRASIQYFGLSLNEGKESGHFTDTLFAAQYRATDRFGLGAGFNRFDLDAEMTRGPLRFTLKHAYNGFLLYVFGEF